MKKLTFTDGSSMDVLDESSQGYIAIMVECFSKIDAFKGRLTKENLKLATLGSEKMINEVPTGMTVTVMDDGMIKVVFGTRALTHDEKVDKQIAELQQAVAELGEAIIGGMH